MVPMFCVYGKLSTYYEFSYTVLYCLRCEVFLDVAVGPGCQCVFSQYHIWSSSGCRRRGREGEREGGSGERSRSRFPPPNCVQSEGAVQAAEHRARGGKRHVVREKETGDLKGSRKSVIMKFLGVVSSWTLCTFYFVVAVGLKCNCTSNLLGLLSRVTGFVYNCVCWCSD